MIDEFTAQDRQAILRRQRRLWLISVAAMVGGVVLSTPAAIPVGVVVGLLALAREAWLRRGVARIQYERVLPGQRAVWGDELRVTLSAQNRSALPVPMLVTADGVHRDIELEEAQAPGAETDAAKVGRDLTQRWSLLPFERIERTLRLPADRRGRLTFGPVHMEASDIFGESVGVDELRMPAQLIVVPRSVAVRGGVARPPRAPFARPRAGFPEDPAHVAGARRYAAGDPPRRIHWKATARTGMPMSKRYDASLDREMVLLLDVQTQPGRAADLRYDADLAESLAVVAASLLRDAIGAGVRCGLGAAAYSYRPTGTVRIDPAGGARHLLTLMDTLGRLSPWASSDFSSLLESVSRWLPRSTELTVVTTRDASEYITSLRRLRRHGHTVRLVVVGERAGKGAAAIRAARFEVRRARLEPDWRSANALELVA